MRSAGCDRVTDVSPVGPDGHRLALQTGQPGYDGRGRTVINDERISQFCQCRSAPLGLQRPALQISLRHAVDRPLYRVVDLIFNRPRKNGNILYRSVRRQEYPTGNLLNEIEDQDGDGTIGTHAMQARVRKPLDRYIDDAAIHRSVLWILEQIGNYGGQVCRNVIPNVRVYAKLEHARPCATHENGLGIELYCLHPR